jgi:hypothetical protein
MISRKNILKSIITILMIVGGSLSIQAQINFNISTGVGTSGPLGPGNTDGNYQVDWISFLQCPLPIPPTVSGSQGNSFNVLNSTTYAQTRSNNWQAGSNFTSCYFYINGLGGPFYFYTPSNCNAFLQTSVLPNYPGSSWIQPTGAIGDHVPYGIYLYGYQFSVPGCYKNQQCGAGSFHIDNCSINLKHLAVRGTLLGYWINGFWHGLNASTNSPIANLSISIPTVQLNTQGPNILAFAVQTELSPCSTAQTYANVNNGYYANGQAFCTYYNQYNYNGACGIFREMTGLNIEGDITLDGGNLQDVNGNSKNAFCLNEDVFIKGESASANGYKIELYANGGTSILASTPILPGSPNSINVTSLFKQQNYTFTQGSYTLKLLVSGPCGWINLSRDFSYNCCDNPNASFSLMVTDGNKVEATSTINGTHIWKLYSTPSVNTGPYSYLQTFSGHNFSWSGSVEGLCYYVTHAISNECGDACASQVACNLNCEDADCIVTTPTNVQYDVGSKTISWGTVPNAAHYLVELVFCDPRCCGNVVSTDVGVNCGLDGGGTPGGGGISVNSTQVKTIVVYGQNYMLTPADFTGLNLDVSPCFSIRVYAVCQNGNRSGGSDYFCSFGNSPAYRMIDGSKDEINSGMKIPDDSKVSIFPNPARDNISIDIKLDTDVEVNISVFDRTGKMIRSFDPIRTNDRKANVKWNTASYGKGIYLVKIVTSDNQVFNKKLVIE